MHRQRSVILGVIVLAIIGGIAYGILTANISALPQPGRFETWVATSMKNWYIHKRATASATQLINNSSAVLAGEGLFNMACAFCHGTDAVGPSNIGRAMYPRTLDLRTSEVQHLSNTELFWVIKNGVRLSGMPGFGNILSDNEIWQVTYYLRSRPNSTK